MEEVNLKQPKTALKNDFEKLEGVFVTITQTADNIIQVKLKPKGYDKELIWNLIIPSKEQLREEETDLFPKLETNVFPVNVLTNENTCIENEIVITDNFTSLKDESGDDVDTVISNSYLEADDNFIDYDVEESFQCDKCNHFFSDDETLKTHLQSVHSENKYKCTDCNSSFAFLNTLLLHANMKHIVNYKGRCKICRKLFSSKEQLRHHIRFHEYDDPDEKKKYQMSYTRIKKNVVAEPFTGVCEICSKVFPHRSALNSHIRKVHTDVRSYLCPICGKSYKYENDMVRHQIVHTGERPYKCDECGKGFRRTYHLNQHKHTHATKVDKSQVCYICGLTFKQLSRHQKKKHRVNIAREPKIYDCLCCDLKFTSARNRRNHLKKHEQNFKMTL